MACVLLLESWLSANHSVGGGIVVAVLTAIWVWRWLSGGAAGNLVGPYIIMALTGWLGWWLWSWLRGRLWSILRRTNNHVLCHIVMAWLSLNLLWWWLCIRFWCRFRCWLRCWHWVWSRIRANHLAFCQIKMAWHSLGLRVWSWLLVWIWLWWWLWLTIWANDLTRCEVKLAHVLQLKQHFLDIN